MKSKTPTTERKELASMIGLLVFFLLAEPVVDWILAAIFF